MDDSHHYDRWRKRFIVAFAAAEKQIGRKNGIFPAENWMTVHLQAKVHPDPAKKERITSYIFDPAIDEWCIEQNVKITVKTVMVLEHEMPYMAFERFSDLLRFKLTFQ